MRYAFSSSPPADEGRAGELLRIAPAPPPRLLNGGELPRAWPRPGVAGAELPCELAGVGGAAGEGPVGSDIVLNPLLCGVCMPLVALPPQAVVTVAGIPAAWSPPLRFEPVRGVAIVLRVVSRNGAVGGEDGLFPRGAGKASNGSLVEWAAVPGVVLVLGVVAGRSGTSSSGEDVRCSNGLPSFRTLCPFTSASLLP